MLIATNNNKFIIAYLSQDCTGDRDSSWQDCALHSWATQGGEINPYSIQIGRAEVGKWMASWYKRYWFLAMETHEKIVHLEVLEECINLEQPKFKIHQRYMGQAVSYTVPFLCGSLRRYVWPSSQREHPLFPRLYTTANGMTISAFRNVSYQVLLCSER